MTWNIDSEPRPGADRLHLHWTGAETNYDVILRCDDGVRRTSVGNSSRAQMKPFDKPIQGIFRWSDEVARPTVRVEWRSSPDGPVLAETIELG